MPAKLPGPSAPPWSPGVLAVAALLGIAALIAYHNSFTGPFVFDDVGAIVKNPSIRNLWPPGDALLGPADGSPAAGRPLVHLSLAVNYALGGLGVRGYHAVNFLIHLCAGLALFGVVRRTLLLPGAGENPGPSMRERFGPRALALAACVAALWLLHPLQTEAVTYVVQRAESLAGLFLLLTLYCFIRGAEWQSVAGGRRSATKWFALSVAACLAGMASKEVMVSAPLLVLLYDRTFTAGSFRDAWRRRRPVYAGLAATWLLLALLVAQSGNRGGSAGFGSAVAWWEYAFTQVKAIVLYLQLSFWPHPLVFDYGTAVTRDFSAVAPQAAVVAFLVAGTAVALVRVPRLGFIGVWFFAILAPSSSVVPVLTQTMAEHRMYLPLAAVIVLVVLGLQMLLGSRGAIVCAIFALVLGWVTIRRNDCYRSAIALWADTAASYPANARAHYNLATAFMIADRAQEALPEFERAVRLDPLDADIQSSLGVLLASTGQVPAALGHLEQAAKLAPGDAEAHFNLGNALLELGRPSEAIVHYEQALRLNPAMPDLRENLAQARRQQRSSPFIFH